MAIERNRHRNVDTKKACCGCLRMSKRKVLQDIDDKSSEQSATYYEQLKKPLVPGTFVTIPGCVLSNCLRFSIDLVCNQGNIAFHFNPRLEQHYVVRNCRINGSWGDEETSSTCKFDFRPLKEFVVSILVCEEEYMVLVNGKHHSSFGHRLPCRQVERIEVQGNVEVKRCEISQVAKYPPKELNDYPEVPFDVDVDVENTKSLDVPYTVALRKGFKPGWQLEIYGRVKMLPHSFYVNLQDRAHFWPHPIIPLHLNPRFGSAIGANTFVRNSWTEGGWKQEERAPTFPFIPGHSFCMTIRMDGDSYSVWVDGKLTGEFKAIPGLDHTVRCLHIQGDVHINHVTMRSEIKNAYFADPLEAIVRL